MDEDEPKRPASHMVGEDLTTLSEEELAERIALLKGEIERVEAELTRKQTSRNAAASFFKNPSG